MLISSNGTDFLNIDEQMEGVIQYYISSDIFEDDMKRRITWIIGEIYQEALKKLKTDWVKGGLLAANEINNIPTDDNSLIQLILSQPNYQDKKARDDARIAAELAAQQAAQIQAQQDAQLAADARQAEINAAVQAALKAIQT